MRWRSARRTHVLPTPGSPTTTTEARSSSASRSASTTSCVDVGSQRAPSGISLEYGGSVSPKCARYGHMSVLLGGVMAWAATGEAIHERASGIERHGGGLVARADGTWAAGLTCSDGIDGMQHVA